MNLTDGKIGPAAAGVWSCCGTYRNAQPQRPRRLGRRHYFAGVIEGRLGIPGRSDLSPSSTCPRGPLASLGRQSLLHKSRCTLHDQKRLVSPARRCGNADLTLTGQRRYTDERLLDLESQVGATSRSGGWYGLWPATAPLQTSPHYRCNLGNPRAEKVRPHRPRQLFL